MSTGDRVTFVSGANRGIGFGTTVEMAKQGFNVVAGYRDENRAESLFAKAKEYGKIFPVKVDVTIESDLEQLYDFIERRFAHLDILINCAGVNVNEPAQINELAWADFAQSILVNLGGPFLTSKYLFPLLKKGTEKKVINISSQMGSIQLSGGGATPYRVSKAALNMLTKNQAIEYKREGITVVCLHPGWVKTDMGGTGAKLSAMESVNGIVNIISKLTMNDNGKSLGWDGAEIPW